MFGPLYLVNKDWPGDIYKGFGGNFSSVTIFLEYSRKSLIDGSSFSINFFTLILVFHLKFFLNRRQFFDFYFGMFLCFSYC